MEDDTLRFWNEEPNRLIARRVLGRSEGIDFAIPLVGTPFSFPGIGSVVDRLGRFL